MCVEGQRGDAVVSSAASQQEGSGFSTTWPEPFLHVLLMFVWVLSGYSGFLPQSIDMQLVGLA